MKRFLVKLLKCTCIFVAFAFIVGQGIHWYLQACYEHGKHLSPTPNILVVGDSQFETGVNPDVLKGSYNCSRSSLTYKYAYSKIKYYCEHNSIDTIFLSLAYHSLYKMGGTSDAIPTRALEQELSFDAPLIFNDKDLYRSFDSIPDRLLFRKYELMYKFGILNRDWLGEIIYTILKRDMTLRCIKGGYVNYTYSKVSDEDFAKRFKSNILRQKDTITPWNENIYYLHKIVEYCKDNNKVLYMINTPIHERLWAYYSPVQRQTDSIANKFTNSQLHYINLSHISLPDSLYKDHNHLNYLGAKWLSLILLKYPESQRDTNYIHRAS